MECVINAEICIIISSRPAAPICISDNVLPHKALANLDCVPRDLYRNMSDCMQWLMWLAEHCLIRNSNVCGSCQHQMCLTRHEESLDGFSWRCRGGNMRVSVRTGSFFCSLWTQYGENSNDVVLVGP